MLRSTSVLAGLVLAGLVTGFAAVRLWHRPAPATPLEIEAAQYAQDASLGLLAARAVVQLSRSVEHPPGDAAGLRALCGLYKDFSGRERRMVAKQTLALIFDAHRLGWLDAGMREQARAGIAGIAREFRKDRAIVEEAYRIAGAAGLDAEGPVRELADEIINNPTPDDGDVGAWLMHFYYPEVVKEPPARPAP